MSYATSLRDSIIFIVKETLMVDIADQASLVEQRLLEAALRNSKQNTETAKPTGYCLYCGEPVEGSKRWCSIECRDDFEQDQKLKCR